MKLLVIFALLLCALTVQAQTTSPATAPPPPVPTTSPTGPAPQAQPPSAAAAQTQAEATTGAHSAATGRNIVLPPAKSAPVTIPRFERPPTIDGRLDDEVWRHAIVLRDFYQISPGDNIAPSKQTEVFIGYDSRFLYFDGDRKSTRLNSSH